MTHRFVGRPEEIENLAITLADTRPGPVVVSGERGIGRTSLLAQVGGLIDSRRDRLVTVEAVSGPGSILSLRPYLPANFPAGPAAGERIPLAADALAQHFGADRRPVLVLDDAHLVDHATMLVLRELHRRTGAVLVLSSPSDLPPEDLPDNVDSLRYEPDFRMLVLRPLTVDEVGALLRTLGRRPEVAIVAALHAASGGNPALLDDLLAAPGWPTSDGPPADDRSPRRGLTERGVRRLLDAVTEAWRDLELDRLDELCRLAAGNGGLLRVAPAWSGALMLRGLGEEGLRLLDGLGLPAARERRFPRLVLARALVLGLCLGRVEDAAELLQEAGGYGGVGADRLSAAAAWLLASTGHGAAARELVDAVEATADREVALFSDAALAAVALAEHRPAAAVSHLRRSLIGLDGLRCDHPWLRPHLTAELIDALLLSDRVNEATSLAAAFHAAKAGSGWEVAVALSSMITARSPGNQPGGVSGISQINI